MCCNNQRKSNWKERNLHIFLFTMYTSQVHYQFVHLFFINIGLCVSLNSTEFPSYSKTAWNMVFFSLRRTNVLPFLVTNATQHATFLLHSIQNFLFISILIFRLNLETNTFTTLGLMSNRNNKYNANKTRHYCEMLWKIVIEHGKMDISMRYNF